MGKGTPDYTRYLHIYTRSREQKEKLETIAKEAGATTSAFYLNLIEEWEAKQAGIEPPRANDAPLKEEIARLREDLRIKNMLLEKYESEVRLLRGEDFLQADFRGRRQFDADLLEVLRHGYVNDAELLKHLHVDPRDTAGVQGVAAQLRELEMNGFITKTQRGWKWLG